MSKIPKAYLRHTKAPSKRGQSEIPVLKDKLGQFKLYWEAYQEFCFPPGIKISRIELEEARKAFLAGYVAAVTHITCRICESEIPDEESAKLLALMSKDMKTEVLAYKIAKSLSEELINAIANSNSEPN